MWPISDYLYVDLIPPYYIQLRSGFSLLSKTVYVPYSLPSKQFSLLRILGIRRDLFWTRVEQIQALDVHEVAGPESNTTSKIAGAAGLAVRNGPLGRSHASRGAPLQREMLSQLCCTYFVTQQGLVG